MGEWKSVYKQSQFFAGVFLTIIQNLWVFTIELFNYLTRELLHGAMHQPFWPEQTTMRSQKTYNPSYIQKAQLTIKQFFKIEAPCLLGEEREVMGLYPWNLKAKNTTYFITVTKIIISLILFFAIATAIIILILGYLTLKYFYVIGVLTETIRTS